MLKRVILFVAMSSLISSCAHSEGQVDGSSKLVKGQALSDRDPARQTFEHVQVLEKKFTGFYDQAARRGTDAFVSMLDNLVKVYYKSDERVKAFDLIVSASNGDSGAIEQINARGDRAQLLKDVQAYDKGVMSSQVWQRLQVYRSIKDRLTDILGYYYLRLLIENEKEREVKDPTRKARIILSDINRRMTGAIKSRGPEALPYKELDEARRDLIFQYNTLRRQQGLDSVDESALVSPQKGLTVGDLFSDGEAMKGFYRRHKKKINQYMSTPDVKLGIGIDAGDRAPDSSYFQPSTGRRGNIIGSKFPRNHWTLTYDDGPKDSTTLQIVKLLEGARVPAVFFWLRKMTKVYPKSVKKVISLRDSHDMEVANHSYTHYNLGKANNERLNYEITQSSKEHRRQYHDLGIPESDKALRFFRLPYGSGVSKSKVRQKIAKNDLIHVFWNVDSLDWQDKNPKSVLKRVKQQVKNRKGGVILFHDIHSSTVKTTKLLLADASFQSVKWKNLSQMVEIVKSQPAPPSKFEPVYDKDYYVHVNQYLNVREQGSRDDCGDVHPNDRVRIVSGAKPATGKNAYIRIDKALSPAKGKLSACRAPVVSANFLKLYPKP